MDARCSKCNEVFPSQHMLSHFKRNHPNIFGVAYCCIRNGCNRKYTNYNSFYRHKLTCKDDIFINREENSVVVENSDVEMIEITKNNESDDCHNNSVAEPNCHSHEQKDSHDKNINNTDPDDDVNSNNNNESYTNNSFFDILLDFASDLYGDSKLTRSQAENIIKKCNDLIVDNLFPLLRKFINNHVNDSNTKEKFSCMLHKFQLNIDQILSEAKITTQLKKNNYYIEHKEVIFESNVNEYAKTNKKFHSKGYLLPLPSVLKNFFELPQVYHKTVNYMRKLQNDDSNNGISNIIQTDFWKKKIKDCKNLTIPLLLYEDEFECGNPLGSHKTINIMTGVYYSIACLPPEIRSKLSNIFLFQIYYSSDKVYCESKEIYKEIIKQLNDVATTGVTLDISGKQIKINFQLALITGDNLGLNKILGFQTVFLTSRNFCRFCRRSKKNMPFQYTLHKCKLRTIKNYKRDIKSNKLAIMGIKEIGVMNEIKNFHVVDNPCVDVMHDILEGIARTEMAIILKKMIEIRLISLKDFNERLRVYPFDKKFNKPPSITQNELKDKIIKKTAAEMQCLILHFGIIVGGLVETALKLSESSSSKRSHYYDYWELYFYLRKILCITLQTRIAQKDIKDLETSIMKHHKLLAKLEIKMTPKHHLLLHYPHVMTKIGSVRHVWCMRFESKHSLLKHFAIRSNNRKNLCKTIVSKEQLRLSNLFIKKTQFFISTSFEDSKETHLKEDILNLNLIDLSTYCEIQFLEINNITYNIGSILKMNNNEKPMYAEISGIFREISKNEEQPEFYFIVKLYKCNNINNILQCYRLFELQNYKRLQYSKLLYVQPRNKLSINGKMYVAFDNHMY